MSEENRNLMRVHELAKQRGMPVGDMIAILKEKHMDVGSHMRMLTRGQVKEAIYILEANEKEKNPPEEVVEEAAAPKPEKPKFNGVYALGGVKKDGKYLVLTYEINPDTLEATLVDTVETTTRARAFLKLKELTVKRGDIN